MKDIQEKKYCKKIINEAVREAFNEIMFEETKPKKKTTTINESDALVFCSVCREVHESVRAIFGYAT